MCNKITKKCCSNKKKKRKEKKDNVVNNFDAKIQRENKIFKS